MLALWEEGNSEAALNQLNGDGVNLYNQINDALNNMITYNMNGSELASTNSSQVSILLP